MVFDLTTSLNNIKVDSVKYGLALILVYLVSGRFDEILRGALLEKQSLMILLFILIGFAAYQLLVVSFVNTSSLSGSVKMVANNFLKWGTMFIVAQLLSGGKLNDPQWLEYVAYVLAGFATYDILTSRLSDNASVAAMESNARNSVNDVIKFATMFVVARWLSSGAFNSEWAWQAGAFTVGVAAYDYLLHSLVAGINV